MKSQKKPPVQAAFFVPFSAIVIVADHKSRFRVLSAPKMPMVQ